MDLKKMLLPAALLATLSPFAAFAHEQSQRIPPRPMPATYENQGRYELRTTQQWVPGRSEQVWVPEQCTVKHHRFAEKVRCRPGYYDNRWTPGHYESVQQWVWIPFEPRYQGQYPNQYPGQYPGRYHDSNAVPRHQATPVPGSSL